VILAVFCAVVRAQEHLAAIMPFHSSLFKMVGLHYTPFLHAGFANKILPSTAELRMAEFDASATNLG
jgi:hypothetical protein